ncbi:TetR/AcrR family transcriptional regulator [Nocardia wallacei]|uniref:TetR/AcrR family transcriptional regulator n=1 Tax=Nocardia wallacei TaxID=480035 RepID=UPI002453BEA3|nr:TetR/AcrR family transcriptional regulator [Nocardia wallacei]
MTADAPTPRRTAADTREHVLHIAGDLFYKEGVRATGVDRVAAAAAIAPPPLYRVFASKDDLVAAYVERADRHYRAWFEAAVATGRDARESILAVFDALAEQVAAPDCRGCPFLIVLGEFPDDHVPAHRRAVTMKRWVRAQFGALVDALAETSPVADRLGLADDLFLIMEGVYATVQSLGPHGPARRARALVDNLLPN